MDWTQALVADPAFYAVAVPAVLLTGLAKSGVAAGFGALAVPLMALAVPVPQAAAIMLPLLAVMDVIGVASYLKSGARNLPLLMLPAGLAGTVVGTLLFGLLAPAMVAGLVGVLTLLFLVQRLFFPPRADAPPPPRWLGALLAMASGFTSFVAHAGGPPLHAYLLPLKLSPVRFAATSAVFFAVINASKWLPYAWLGLIDLRNMATAVVLMPLAPVGVWIGVRIVRRIDPRWFYRLLYAGMLFAGLKLLWDAWAA